MPCTTRSQPTWASSYTLTNSDRGWCSEASLHTGAAKIDVRSLHEDGRCWRYTPDSLCALTLDAFDAVGARGEFEAFGFGLGVVVRSSLDSFFSPSRDAG